MIETFGQFVSALRKADIAVSPAETLDAARAITRIGIDDRTLLRNSLALLLAKTPEEKASFTICFERFFGDGQARGSHDQLQAFVSAAKALGNGDGSEEGHDGDGDHPQQARRRRGKAGHHSSLLGHLLLSGDSDGLALAMRRAAAAIGLQQIRSLRERALYQKRMLLHLGTGELDDEISRLQRSESGSDRQTAALLKAARAFLEGEVRDHVENAFYLLVDGTGQRFLTDAVSDTHLTVMQPYYFDHIREAVRKLAQRLAKRHARRIRRQNRGQLDLHRTLRRNLAYDGNLFELRWKQVNRQRPTVYVICDVSGSVSNVARFLLTFLYSLQEVLPRVRAFAFSSDLGEVTDYFRQFPLEEAITMSLDDYGKGSTDYGKAFRMFTERYLGDLDSHATVIVLGDSRNNYFAPGAEYLKAISQRVRQVVWLNPEPRNRWREGDAEMTRYLPYCQAAHVCNSLKDLEQIVSGVLRTTERI